MIPRRTGRLWYVGDLHSKSDYLRSIVGCAENQDVPPDALIQVGDFRVMWPKYTKGMDAYLRERASEGWRTPIITVGGNHDNWDLFLKLGSESTSDLIEIVPNSGVYYARRGSVISIGGISHGFLGGALSTNQGSLTENVNWWRAEEPTGEDFLILYNNLLTNKPNTIITHEAPRIISFKRKHRNSNATVRKLDEIFWNLMKEGYKPSRWYFGHHHRLDRWKVAGVKFYCCGLNGQYWERE